MTVYQVVRIGYRLNDAEVLGTYRWKWMARIHNAWANIGIRMAHIKGIDEPS